MSFAPPSKYVEKMSIVPLRIDACCIILYAYMLSFAVCFFGCTGLLLAKLNLNSIYLTLNLTTEFTILATNITPFILSLLVRIATKIFLRFKLREIKCCNIHLNCQITTLLIPKNAEVLKNTTKKYFKGKCAPEKNFEIFSVVLLFRRRGLALYGFCFNAISYQAIFSVPVFLFENFIL